MEIGGHWTAIRNIFDEAFKSGLHFAVASVGEDGAPHVTPIGALILRDDRTGFYFEEHPVRLPRHLSANPRVSILAVNADKVFWGTALAAGKFLAPPAVRLSGTAGRPRQATPEEIALWRKKIAGLEGLKGYSLLWGHFSTVRDIAFDAFAPVEMGEMTNGLWG